MRARLLSSLAILLASACNASGEAVESGNSDAPAASNGRPFAVREVARFAQPWAMAFIPGTQQALITEKEGRLKLLWSDTGRVGEVAGAPTVDYGGQGGFGDVAFHPDFERNRLVYLSWIEAGEGGRGAVVGRAKFVTDGGAGPRLEGMQIVWRQQPKLSGRGHYAHRIRFSPDGDYMFISSGDRQEFTPAQDMNGNLGKILRLRDDGSVPSDNPFASRGGVTAQIWSLGHRNPLGLAFAPDGRLWEHEMGPAGGDEFNLIERGSNYGYPIVSNGDHYDGTPIPDHDTQPEYNAPEISWTPVISPSSLIFYTGSLFPQWRGSALIGALSGKALVRVTIDGNNARVADRWDMGERIREVEQGPDGSVWLLEDQQGGGSGGRLLKLTPAR